MVPDKDGKMQDVVLGFDSIQDYISKPSDFGASIGRYANRINQVNSHWTALNINCLKITTAIACMVALKGFSIVCSTLCKLNRKRSN